MTVRSLTKHDLSQVKTLDEQSGFCVSQWIECLEDSEEQDYAFGSFLGDTLVGYCTLGYADDCERAIECYSGYTYNSLLLSDVFVTSQWRHRRVASKMLMSVLLQAGRTEHIFLTYMRDELISFYHRFGFVPIPDSYAMVLPKVV